MPAGLEYKMCKKVPVSGNLAVASSNWYADLFILMKIPFSYDWDESGQYPPPSLNLHRHHSTVVPLC